MYMEQALSFCAAVVSAQLRAPPHVHRVRRRLLPGVRQHHVRVRHVQGQQRGAQRVRGADAMAARCISGLLNGKLGGMKAYLADGAVAFSYLAISYSMSGGVNIHTPKVLHLS